MKDFIKFFSIITGLFRSIISILLLFSVGFVIFVDTNLFLASLDLFGINNISQAAVKPIALGILILAFVINTAITRSIFKAGENGKSHLANLFFGLVFLACDVFLYLYFKENLLYILIGLNGLLVLNSLIGLIAKLKGVYNTGEVEKKTEYIEVKTGDTDKKPNEDPIKIDFKEDNQVNIVKKDDTKRDGKTVVRKSQLIEKDTDLTGRKKDNRIIIKKDINAKAKKDATKKIQADPPKTLGDVKKENNKVNKILASKEKSDKTYDPDLAKDFKKQEEEKIYDKSKFIRDED